jgi:SAM-dependent methyltransferase
VELSRKIAKLRTGEAWASVVSAYYRWRKPLNALGMVRELEAKGFDRIRSRYANPDDKTGWPKYVDAGHWLKLAVRQARGLRLDRRKPLRILDIGSGAGYFLFVCRQFGHTVMGLDLDWPSMYAETFELMQISRRIWRIEPLQPLPDLGLRFDLVTGFAVCFNSHGSSQVWTAKEWEYFLNDVQKNVLAEQGEIYLELNPEPWGYYTPELGEFFRKRHARVDGKSIWIAPQGRDEARPYRRIIQ